MLEDMTKPPVPRKVGDDVPIPLFDFYNYASHHFPKHASPTQKAGITRQGSISQSVGDIFSSQGIFLADHENLTVRVGASDSSETDVSVVNKVYSFT